MSLIFLLPTDVSLQDLSRHTLISPINSDEQYYLVDVVAFILKYLKDQLYAALGKSDLDMSRVQFDWVVTVPAIWDIRGKQMMREAAYKVNPVLSPMYARGTYQAVKTHF